MPCEYNLIKIVCSFKVCFKNKKQKTCYLCSHFTPGRGGGAGSTLNQFCPCRFPSPGWGCPSCSFFYILFCSCVMSLLMVFTNIMQVLGVFCGYIVLRCVVQLFMVTQFPCLVFQCYKLCLKDHLSIGVFLNSAYRLKLKFRK